MNDQPPCTRLATAGESHQSLTWLVVFATLVGCSAPPPAGPFEPTLESLQAHEVPEWFRDAKFGIFVHWGAYSVPAYGAVDGAIRQLSYAEWYWFIQLLYGGEGPINEYHLSTFGPSVVYDDFLRDWRAEEFDARAFTAAIADAGARYTVLVSKHHDGIALFRTRTTNRSTTDFGPRRDLVREFVDAARENGLRVGLYYSLLEWFHPNYDGDNGRTHLSDALPLRYPERVNPFTNEPVEYLGYRPIDDFVEDHHLPQLRELVNQYDPDLLWFDGDWDLPMDYWRSLEAVSYFYNRHGRHEEVVVNDRLGTGRPAGATWWGDYPSLEYSLPDAIQERYFESTRGLGNSFGYNQFESLDDYLTADEVIETLVDVVSKNGNLLLNIGPTASGTIPEVQLAVLRGVGAWQRQNGAAIYSSRPWNTAGRDGVRYTTQGRTLYVHLLEEPTPGMSVALSDAVPTDPTSVALLGCAGTGVSLDPRGAALTLDGPECGSHVWVVALSYDHEI